MIVPADCEDCGACCAFDSPTFVPLNTADQEHLGARLEELTHEEAGQRYMRMHEGYCLALDRSGGASQCSIYDQRPELCREFHQGSSECRSVLLSIRRRKAG
jgi:Fe-S-cluster containining protein